jgi:PAS domain-containing protein
MSTLFSLTRSIFLLVLLLFCTTYAKPTGPVTNNGVLDLSSWNFKKDGTVSCNGQWEYYRNQLIEPHDFTSDSSQIQNCSYADPGVWKNRTPDSLSLSTNGFATYRLIITGIDTVENKAIRLADQSTAYRLWIDGIEYSRRGVIGNTRAQSRLFSGIDIVSFHPHEEKLEIVMQVCNFWYSYSNGGSVGPIFVGDESQIRMGQDKRWVLQLFLITTLFVIGLYNTVIFLMRKKDRAPLYFGVFCLLISINTLVSASGDWLLQELYTMMPGLLLFKIDIITVMLSTPCFVMFINSFFPSESKKAILPLLQVVTAIFLPFVIFLSGRPLALVFELFYPVIIAMIVYSVIIAVAAVKNEQTDAVWVLTGIFIMSLAGINDILWGIGVLHTPILIPAATFIFILIYSTLISRRFSLAFAGAERLSVELLENQRLRDEMQIRIKQEQDLRQVERRLTSLLHAIDEILCAVYSTGEIAFCNRAFEEFTGYASQTLIGRPLKQFLHTFQTEQGIVSECNPEQFLTNQKSGKVTVTFDNNEKSFVREMVKIPLELEDEELWILVFRIPGQDSQQGISTVAFIEALNRNRSRIQSLQDMMINATPEMIQANPKLGHELKMIDMNLEQIGALLINDDETERKKRLCSEIITLSLRYWTESTGKTKIDLARESDLWKVQANQDGWERAQTLDRYLDFNTFPKIPRWNQITKTADFVLLRCTLESPLREKLESALQQLHILT